MSDKRKEVLVPVGFFNWFELYFRKLATEAIRQVTTNQHNEHTRALPVYNKIVRMLDQITAEQRLQPSIPIALARKEAKTAWVHASKVLENLSTVILPEYNNRIAKKPEMADYYKPYIEKTIVLKGQITLGLAELRRLL